MGTRGVGFLFAMIALFLLVVCLKQTGHATLAIDCGVAGSVLLALSTGLFLARRWRSAEDESAFHQDGDVAFALAVFLLVTAVPMVAAAAQKPALLLLVLLAATPARMFVKTLRHRR